MKDANGILPAIAIDKVVPVRNDIADRATRVAERNAAIHAARSLHAHLLFRERLVHLKIIVNALGDGTPRRCLARVFLEPGDLTHGSSEVAQALLPVRGLARAAEFAQAWHSAKSHSQEDRKSVV